MTLPPSRIGDRGQRYEVRFKLEGPDIHTLGFTASGDRAVDLANSWAKHPTKPYTWVVDRKLPFNAPVRNVGNFRLEGRAPNSILVDRSTPFGNPYPLVSEGLRRACLQRFSDYAGDRMRTDAAWAQAVRGLRGKRLLCWCYPKACHADVLQCLAEGPE